MGFLFLPLLYHLNHPVRSQSDLLSCLWLAPDLVILYLSLLMTRWRRRRWGWGSEMSKKSTGIILFLFVNNIERTSSIRTEGRMTKTMKASIRKKNLMLVWVVHEENEWKGKEIERDSLYVSRVCRFPRGRKENRKEDPSLRSLVLSFSPWFCRFFCLLPFVSCVSRLFFFLSSNIRLQSNCPWIAREVLLLCCRRLQVYCRVFFFFLFQSLVEKQEDGETWVPGYLSCLKESW